MTSIIDIARRSGVSKSTVARVLSRKGSFSKSVEEKVLCAATELNYRPNGIARAMKTKRTNVIGVVIYRRHMPVISHPFYAPILDSIATALSKQGYGILVVADSDVTNESGNWLLEQRVDGLILLSQITSSLIHYFSSISIPFVLVNNSEMVDCAPFIVNDDALGAREAANHLIERGYQTIAYVSGSLEHRSYRLRWEGFKQVLQEHGIDLPSEYLFVGDSVIESGRNATERFLSLKERPRAIFASNDMMAIGVLRGLYYRKISVPEECAVLGFDDIDYAKLTTPSLTTVHIDKDAMGTMAVNKLLSLLNHDNSNPEGIVIPPKLIVRETT